MYTCQYCGKNFTREKTLTVHMCEPKRRHMVQNDRHVRMAFRAYQRFYDKSMNAKKPKTYEEFAKRARQVRRFCSTNGCKIR